MLRWSASLDPERVLRTCERVHALGRLGQPDEVARLVAFLAGEEASFLSGAAYSVDGRRRLNGSRGWHGLPGVRHRRFAEKLGIGVR